MFDCFCCHSQAGCLDLIVIGCTVFMAESMFDCFYCHSQAGCLELTGCTVFRDGACHTLLDSEATTCVVFVELAVLFFFFFQTETDQLTTADCFSPAFQSALSWTSFTESFLLCSKCAGKVETGLQPVFRCAPLLHPSPHCPPPPKKNSCHQFLFYNVEL